MKRLKRLFFVSVAAVLSAVSIGSCDRNTDEETAIRLASEVKAVNRLVLAQMSISKMASIADLDLEKATGPKQSLQALVDALKIGDRKAAFSYDTYMRAYIDLSNFSEDDVRVNNSDSTISIVLPAVQTEFAGRDAQMRVEHYRVTGLRSQIGAEERAQMKEQINSALRQEVENDATFRSILTESAKSKGRKYFEDLCGRYGYKANVTFK